MAIRLRELCKPLFDHMRAMGDEAEDELEDDLEPEDELPTPTVRRRLVALMSGISDDVEARFQSPPRERLWDGVDPERVHAVATSGRLLIGKWRNEDEAILLS